MKETILPSIQSSPKKLRKSKIKEQKKELLKEQKNKLLKIVKRKILNLVTVVPPKKRKFLPRTSEQERELLYIFEKEGLTDEHYRFLHYAWNVRMKPNERPKIRIKITDSAQETEILEHFPSAIFVGPKEITKNKEEKEPLKNSVQSLENSVEDLKTAVKASQEFLSNTMEVLKTVKTYAAIKDTVEALSTQTSSIEEAGEAFDELYVQKDKAIVCKTTIKDLEALNSTAETPKYTTEAFEVSKSGEGLLKNADIKNSNSNEMDRIAEAKNEKLKSLRDADALAKETAEALMELGTRFLNDSADNANYWPKSEETRAPDCDNATVAKDQLTAKKSEDETLIISKEMAEEEPKERFALLNLAWVSPIKSIFENVKIVPILEKDLSSNLKFNNETFEKFYYEDPMLNDLIPLPSGSARTQGFFRPSIKRKIHDHRARRLKFIREKEYLQNGLNPILAAEIAVIPSASGELIMDDRQARHKIVTPFMGKGADRLQADKFPTPSVLPSLSASTMHLQHLLHRSATNPLSSFDNTFEPVRKAVFEKFRQKGLKFCRSSIHGWGLYAEETIGADEVIIEYVGERVRHSLADVREIKYEKSGIGSSYMFRIDDELVIDATYCGNYARFINHCCKPNCYAKIVSLNGVDKRIFIYSKTLIEKGEELTYDYKFEREEAARRVPCFCYTKGCRKFLN